MVTKLNLTLPELISKLVRNNAYCMSCSARLYTDDFRSRYEKDKAGDRHITTKDIKYPMWVYGQCPSCSYQTALWKIAKGISERGLRTQY